MRAEPHVQELEVEFTPKELFQGTDTFQLTDRDINVLRGLLVNNFMLGGQIMAYAARLGTGFPGRKAFSSRGVRLFEHGLIGKAKIQPRDNGGPYSYSYRLSAFGFKVLVYAQDEIADASQDWWTPPAFTRVGRNNPWHQAATVDLLQTLASYGDYSEKRVTWRGPRFAGQKFSEQRGGGKKLSIFPDAVLRVNTKHTLFLEHERSFDPDKILGMLEDYKRYQAIGGWQGAYLTSPHLLFSLNDIDDTQHHTKDPLRAAFEQLQQAYLKNVLLMRERDWRSLRWHVYTLDHPKPTDIWTALAQF